MPKASLGHPRVVCESWMVENCARKLNRRIVRFAMVLRQGMTSVVPQDGENILGLFSQWKKFSSAKTTFATASSRTPGVSAVTSPNVSPLGAIHQPPVDCPITASCDPRPIASTELRLPRASKGATEIYLCPRPRAHAETRATAALANQPVPNISLRCHASR